MCSVHFHLMDVKFITVNYLGALWLICCFSDFELKSSMQIRRVTFCISLLFSCPLCVSDIFAKQTRNQYTSLGLASSSTLITAYC